MSNLEGKAEKDSHLRTQTSQRCLCSSSLQNDFPERGRQTLAVGQRRLPKKLTCSNNLRNIVAPRQRRVPIFSIFHGAPSPKWSGRLRELEISVSLSLLQLLGSKNQIFLLPKALGAVRSTKTSRCNPGGYRSNGATGGSRRLPEYRTSTINSSRHGQGENHRHWLDG